MRRVPDETMRRLEAVLRDSAAAHEGVRVVRPEQRVAFDEPADLLLESGSRETLPAARCAAWLPESGLLRRIRRSS